MNVYYFPQLRRQAFAQYPALRFREYRTVASGTVGSNIFRAADTGAARTRWRLHFAALDDSERGIVDEFFSTVKGSLQPFTFLDPMDNLVSWSEDFSQGVWYRSPGLITTGGAPDRNGELLATRVFNPFGTTLELTQLMPIPAWFGYTASVYARATEPMSASLIVRGDATTHRQTFSLAPEWTRLILQAASLGEGETVTVGIEIPPLSEVAIQGFQLEPNGTETAYKPTSGAGGIYQRCRLDSNILRWVTAGQSIHSTDLAIVSL